MHINREYIMSSNTEGAHLYPNPYTSVTFGWASGVAVDTRPLQVLHTSSKCTAIIPFMWHIR